MSTPLTVAAASPSYLLTLITFMPALGALLIVLIKMLRLKVLSSIYRYIALLFSGLSLLLIVPVYLGFKPELVDTAQFVHHFVWLKEFNIEYFMGVDGLSMALVILTGLIGFIACLSSMHIEKKPAAYFALFLLLQTGMFGTFCALDMFLFYIFWELMLLPMYFLIGIWGGPRKEYAAIKFFLYTLAGSVLLLLAIIALYYKSAPYGDISLTLVDGTPTLHTFNLLQLAKLGQAGLFTQAGYLAGMAFAKVVFVALFIGFAIKVPMFPFHTWLPDAHVEAPTPISVVLAGILLKMGTYGMLRFNLSILPETMRFAAYAIGVFGVINIIYGAFLCLAQKDLKKMIAYSSISHMGFVLLGLAAMTPQGLAGAVFQMFGHGIVSPLLFLLVGVLYERAHTRDIESFGGLMSHMPEYSALTALAFFASLGLPGLIGFVGEVLVLLGAFGAPPVLGGGFKLLVAIAATAVVFTAAYYLWTLERMFLGRFNERWQGLEPALSWVERLTLYPLAILCIVCGCFPGLILELGNPLLTMLAHLTTSY